MERKDIIEFLNFRKKFSRQAWFEINKAVAERENEKAAKICLDDFDISLVMERLNSNPFLDIED